MLPKKPSSCLISLDVLQTSMAMMCAMARSARVDKRSVFTHSVSGNQSRGKWFQSKSCLTGREASNITLRAAEMGRWGGKLGPRQDLRLSLYQAEVTSWYSQEVQAAGVEEAGKKLTKLDAAQTQKCTSALWRNRVCQRMSSLR